MSLKTDYSYNEDDFVQHGEALKELTVTITLAEYRCLVREGVRSAERIEQLEEELKKVKEGGKAMYQLLMLKSPEILNKFSDLLNEIFPSKTEDGEAEEVNGQG